MRDIEVIDKQTKDKVKQSHLQNREKAMEEIDKQTKHKQRHNQNGDMY